jgi:hypothetical protein
MSKITKWAYKQQLEHLWQKKQQLEHFWQSCETLNTDDSLFLNSTLLTPSPQPSDTCRIMTAGGKSSYNGLPTPLKGRW